MATIDDDRYIDLGLLDAASIVPFDNARALRRAARRNAVRDSSLGLDPDYLSNARIGTRDESNYADVYNRIYDRRRQRYEQNNFTNAQKRQLISDLKRGGNAAQDAFQQYVSRGMNEFGRKYVAPGLAATFAAPFAISGAAILGANPAVQSALGRVASRAGKMIFDPLHAETAAESLIGTGLDVGTTAMTARDLYNRHFSPNKTRYSSVGNYLASGLPRDVLDLTGVLGPAAYYGSKASTAIKTISNGVNNAYNHYRIQRALNSGFPISIPETTSGLKELDLNEQLKLDDLLKHEIRLLKPMVNKNGKVDKYKFSQLPKDVQELANKRIQLMSQLPLAEGVSKQDAIRGAIASAIPEIKSSTYGTEFADIFDSVIPLTEYVNGKKVGDFLPETHPEQSIFTKSNLRRMIDAASSGYSSPYEISNARLNLLDYPKSNTAQLYTPSNVADEYNYARSWAKMYGYPATKKFWGEPGSDRFYEALNEIADRHNSFFRGYTRTDSFDPGDKALTNVFAKNETGHYRSRAGVDYDLSGINRFVGDDAMFIALNPYTSYGYTIYNKPGKMGVITRRGEPFKLGQETVPEYLRRRNFEIFSPRSTPSIFEQYELPYFEQTGRNLRKDMRNNKLDTNSSKAMYDFIVSNGLKQRYELPGFGNNPIFETMGSLGAKPATRFKDIKGVTNGMTPLEAYVRGRAGEQLFDIKEFVDLDDIKRDLDFYRRFNSKAHYFRRWINERQYPITRKTNAFGGYIKL